MHAEPFSCYRPTPERAAGFAALPYDVFDRAEAAAYVATHPESFLAIDRPETAFAPDHDMYADDVYAKAHELLAARVADGTLLRDAKPCYYLYRLEQEGHAQTGIVCAAALSDYADGTIRRHELTRRDKEDDRVRHIKATGCQTGPIFLAYRDDAVLQMLVDAACAAEPLYDFTDEAGVRQTVWRVARPEAVESLRLMLERMPRAYIADGHHRAASAARVCQELRAAHAGTGAGAAAGEKDEPAAGADGTAASPAEAPWDYLLCVLFPASQLTVLPYNRVVADTAGLSEDELVAAVRAGGFAVGERQEAPVSPAERGHVGMWAFGAWRELSWEGPVPADPVAALDVSLLQEHVLGPILGIGDPRLDPRISFVGGSAGTVELERRAGGAGVAFSLHATSVGELMDVADAGQLMPPKSTWFEPKLRSGLFIRRIGAGQAARA